MPQSLTKLYVHLIFSTKNREPFLDDEVRERVHGYLATVIRSADSPYVVVRLGLKHRMNMAFGQDCCFVFLIPGALPQATVNKGRWPNNCLSL